MPNANELFDQVMALPDDERRAFADRLVDALEAEDDELTEEEEAIIAQRIAEYERGEAEVIDAFEAIEQSRRRLRERRRA